MCTLFSTSTSYYWIATIIEFCAGLVVFVFSCIDFHHAKTLKRNARTIKRRARIEMGVALAFLCVSVLTMRGLWLGSLEQRNAPKKRVIDCLNLVSPPYISVEVVNPGLMMMSQNGQLVRLTIHLSPELLK